MCLWESSEGFGLFRRSLQEKSNLKKLPSLTTFTRAILPPDQTTRGDYAESIPAEHQAQSGYGAVGNKRDGSG